MSKGRKWFYACAVLIFIAGLLSGLFASPLIHRCVLKRPDFGEDSHFGKDRFNKGPDKTMIIRKLSSELSLTDAQQKQLRKIFDANEAEFLAKRKEIKKTFDEYHDKVNAQILGILDEKQKEKFKKLEARFGKRRPGPHRNRHRPEDVMYKHKGDNP